MKIDGPPLWNLIPRRNWEINPCLFYLHDSEQIPFQILSYRKLYLLIFKNTNPTPRAIVKLLPQLVLISDKVSHINRSWITDWKANLTVLRLYSHCCQRHCWRLCQPSQQIQQKEQGCPQHISGNHRITHGQWDPLGPIGVHCVTDPAEYYSYHYKQ